MREDKTGWLIVFDGTIYSEWGREFLAARPQRPSEVWSTTTRRHYTRTGKHARLPQSPHRSGEASGDKKDD